MTSISRDTRTQEQYQDFIDEKSEDHDIDDGYDWVESENLHYEVNCGCGVFYSYDHEGASYMDVGPIRFGEHKPTCPWAVTIKS